MFVKPNYNVNALLSMAEQYLIAKEEAALSLLAESSADTAYSALQNACDIVLADIDKVISLQKAMSRYERREKYQKSIYVNYKIEHKVINYLAK